MTHTARRYEFRDKDADYAALARELSGLLGGEPDLIANAANTSALLFAALPDVNWTGFYFLHGGQHDGVLVVGPFQGKPACVRIALGQGVCGTAARQRTTLVVHDVQSFPGHIACDADSRAEIAIPLIAGERLLGVLDLDSPSVKRFDEADRRGLERLAGIFIEASAAQARAPGAGPDDLTSFPG